MLMLLLLCCTHLSCLAKMVKIRVLHSIYAIVEMQSSLFVQGNCEHRRRANMG